MGLATPVLNACMLLCHSPGGFHAKPGRTRRYHVPDAAARTIAALLTIRDQVIAPLLAGIRTPRRGRPPATWTRIDRDYEYVACAAQTGGLDHDRRSRREVAAGLAVRAVAHAEQRAQGGHVQPGPGTPPARVPTTCASCAASSWSYEARLCASTCTPCFQDLGLTTAPAAA